MVYNIYVMLNFKKVLNSKIISIITAIVFLFNGAALGIDNITSKTNLRVPFSTTTGKGRNYHRSRLLVAATVLSSLLVNPPLSDAKNQNVTPFDASPIVSTDTSSNSRLLAWIIEEGYPEEKALAIANAFNRAFHKEVEKFRIRVSSIQELREKQPEAYAEKLKEIFISLFDAVRSNRSLYEYDISNPRIGRLLIDTLLEEDIFDLIEKSSLLSKEQKRKTTEELIACTAKTEMLYFLGKSIGIDIQRRIVPGHAFAFTLINHDLLVLTDFSVGVIRVMKLPEYYEYNQRKQRWELKEELRISAEELKAERKKFDNGWFFYLSEKNSALKRREFIVLLNLLYPHIYVDADIKVASAIYLNIGDVLRMLKRYDRAEEAYNRAIRLNPDFITNYLRLGRIYEETGKIPEAIRQYEKAIILDPYLVSALISLNSLYMRTMRYEKAKEISSRLLELELNPEGFTLARHNLAIAYQRMGDFSKAMRIYEELIKEHPGLPLNYLELGNSYFGAKRYNDAIDVLKKGVLLSRDSFLSVEFYLKIGLAQIESGRYKDAIETFIIALNLSDNSKFYMGLGWAYYKSGNIGEALDNWAKAVSREKELLQELPVEIRRELRIRYPQITILKNRGINSEHILVSNPPGLSRPLYFYISRGSVENSL